MSVQQLIPWLIAAASLGVVAGSWQVETTQPVPVAELPQTTPPQVAPSQAAAPAGTRLVASAAPVPANLEDAVRSAVRAEMSRSVDPPAPDPERLSVMADDQAAALDLVDELIEVGDIDAQDRMDLLHEISNLDRAHAEVVMSAYFDALNRGDIRILGAPL